MEVTRRVVRFGVFEVDLNAGELFKQGRKIRLQEQPFQALSALLERPREIVTREELQKRLWPDTLVDFDRGLNKTINRLREALGDDADNPRFVETVPQRGYRFLMPVEPAPSGPAATPPAAGPLPRRRALIAAGAGLAAVPLLALGYRHLTAARRRIESIAVLPLDNLSKDRDQDYFSDGITEELIGEIANITSVRVISRTSVMRYKGNPRKSLPEIARELDVDAILEGTVAHSEGRVRITVQLVRAWDDRHLWSGRYERDLSAILSLQSEVARTVAREIRVNLTAREQGTLARTRPVKPEAYEAFLRGNYFLHRGIPGVGRSIRHFTQAVQLDPSHPESHAGLAEALIYACIFGLQPSSEGFPLAREAALRALELDEFNSAAHNALADVLKGYDWNLAGAEAEYQRALQSNPSHLLTRLWYAECLARMKRHADALVQSDRALLLDPVSPLSHNSRSMLLFRARRYQDAIGAGRQALELDPQFVNALWWQGMSHAGLGDFPSAIDCLSRGLAMSDGPIFRGLLGHVCGLAGDTARARRLLEEIADTAARRYVSPMDFAILYAGLGDADSTFQRLEQACQTRAARMHEIASMYFDRFHHDPRYPDLIRRVGLEL